MADDYTPTTEEVREAIAEWSWTRRMFRPELEQSDGKEADRWLAAHDAEKRSEWEAEQGKPHSHKGEPMVWCETHQHEHIARMPRFTYLCKDCGWGQWYGDDAREHEAWTQENLREAHTTYEVEHVTRPLAEQGTEEPEGEHVFIERYGAYHAQFGGIGGDVTSLGLTREAWKALGEPDVLAVSWVPVEQEGAIE